MGFLDKIKQAAKDVAGEGMEKLAFEREWDEQQEAIIMLEELAGKGEDGGGLFGKNARRRKWTQDVIGAEDDVVGIAVQGGDPKLSFAGIKALAKQASAEAGELVGEAAAMVDVEIQGEGNAQNWPKDASAWIVLTESFLLILDDPTFPGRREFNVLCYWQAVEIESMGGEQGKVHNTLEIKFLDGSLVRTPISGKTDPAYFSYIFPRRKNIEALERARASDD